MWTDWAAYCGRPYRAKCGRPKGLPILDGHLTARGSGMWPTIGLLLAVQRGQGWSPLMDVAGLPTWPYLAVHIGRVWLSVVDGGGRLLAAHRGQEWAAVVGLSGRPHWTNVVARIGRDWLPRLGEYGRPIWGSFGRPPIRGLDTHARLFVGDHAKGLGGHLYAIWTATWSGGGRRWTHVKLGGHMRVMTPVHAHGV